MIYTGNKDNRTRLLEDRKCPYCSEEYCGAVRMFWHLKDNHIDDIIQERIYELIDNDCKEKNN
jgi:hypothetical protein